MMNGYGQGLTELFAWEPPEVCTVRYHVNMWCPGFLMIYVGRVIFLLPYRWGVVIPPQRSTGGGGGIFFSTRVSSEEL